ncbi:uncharacterized protein [Amphiura filiformis]|uniref:uncharacterized protein n=1 Tax=Amphiura filiformis TaxID=82378 RepID=UPI003B226115
MGRTKGKGKRKPKRGHAKGGNKEGETAANRRAIPRPKSTMTREERIQNRKAKRKTAATYTIDQLLDKVEECMDSFDYELAHKFCKRALELDPDNVSVLETLGNLLAEQGDGEGAMKCFGRAVTVCPDEGFSKYMYLGQLMEGKKAIECFQKGVEIMTKELHKSQSEGACAAAESEVAVSESDISSAYCSMAEIYLTDACFEEEAETRCKECLDKAIEHNPSNAEAFQILASYWLSMENKKEATDAIQKSVSLWLPRMQKAEDDDDDDDETVPLPYTSRIAAAQILIELEQLDTAEEILEGLLEEDDEVVQVWYMMGLVNVYRKTDETKPPARYYLNCAKRLYGKMDCDDGALLEHTEELLQELGPGEGDQEDWLIKKTMNQDDDGMNGQDDDEEEDDEDISSSEDEEEMEQS